MRSARMWRVCVLLVSLCVLGAGSFSGRGFFCRDPDTGKLYPVNTTWPASSFCGNYHCKLRRKNITGAVYAPLRQINITSIKLLGENLTHVDVKNETVYVKKDEEKSIETTTKKAEPDNIDGIIPLNREIIGEKIDDLIDDKNETDQDRYLSDKEIKSLTEILHTVKKSDLDAIVEIYNLAQDIYKEIDKTSTEHVLNEAMYTAKTANNHRTKSDVLRKTKKHGHVSYWYEPLSNSKIRPADLIRSDMSRSETIRNDMIPIIPVVPVDLEVPVINIGNVIQRPTPVAILPAPPTPTSLKPPPAQVRKITDTFFNGPLTHKDFGKLPYYYPMSNFQRMSSYLRKQNQKVESAKSPIAKPTYKSVTYKPKLTGGKYQKEIKPSILLPYPFSNINHYNWTYPQDLYNKQNRIEETQSQRKENPSILKIRLKKTNNAILMNPDLENFQDLHMKPSEKDEKVSPKLQEERPNRDWQTDSLPKQILEEVRAHVQEKQRFLIHPFPLRKKIKLDRVGKLIMMDEVTRTKRSASLNVVPKDGNPLEPELFEVYLERTTCNSDYSVPGYFRYGNLSQPYPECCPQRIST